MNSRRTLEYALARLEMFTIIFLLTIQKWDAAAAWKCFLLVLAGLIESGAIKLNIAYPM